MAAAETATESEPESKPLRKLDSARLNKLGEAMLIAHVVERRFIVDYVRAFAAIAPQAWADSAAEKWGDTLKQHVGEEQAKGMLLMVAEDLRTLFVEQADSFAAGLHMTERHHGEFAFVNLNVPASELDAGGCWTIGLSPEEEAIAYRAGVDPQAPSGIVEQEPATSATPTTAAK
jgi:hypothetical protein